MRYFYSPYRNGWCRESEAGFVSSVPDAVMADLLSREFEQMLRWHMSADDYAAAVATNRIEPNPAICHTHDYIDSNESMLAAFQNLLERDVDHGSETDAKLMTTAWNAWKQRTR